uniref:Tetratricopeptide (TPR) repeat n=1 Tax=Candidatus Kentrum sp. LFY TaxID=2126342 RepID=A0A450WNF0_9GAMM|nr:MAG: Tetratricopeptide (TPR) repeat [Candidatus Kentron sp. LFY]
MTMDSFHKNLQKRFKGSVIPPWLLHFSEDPEAALHDFLRGRALLGHLSGSEPDELLLDWLRGFGTESHYARILDDALTQWIDCHWGEPLLPGTDQDATMTSEAWLSAIDTIAVSPLMDSLQTASPREYPLFGAATLLREKMLADRAFLDDMTEARSRDPQGSAWLALANHQTDRALLDEWWHLVSLPPDEPWYRGEHGLAGLRRLPPENPAFRDSFSKELAEGLGRFGEALWRRAQEGWLPEDIARSEFSALARLTMARGGFRDRWRGYWRHLATRHRGDGFVTWLPISESELEKSKRGKAPWVEPDPAWADRAKTLARALGRPAKETITQAEKLLAEQRNYVNFTGNMSFLVRTACNFSGNIRAADPRQALVWARLAKAADSWNAHAWTNEAAALLAMGEYAQALGVYGEAILWFPDNAVPRTGCAEVLKFLGRLAEALAAYDDTIQRFPENVVARTGRAEVLKLQEKLNEALAAYDDTILRFPNDVVARTGRAEVLKLQEKLNEALAAYDDTIQRFPENVVARNGRAEVLKLQEKLNEALAAYDDTIQRFPENVVARNGRAEVLKLQEKLNEALAAYDDTILRFPNDVVARTGRDGVLRALEQQGQSAASKQRTSVSQEETGFDKASRYPTRRGVAAGAQGRQQIDAPMEAAERPAIVSPKKQALSREEITILTTDAYLIRRWAREGKEDDPWLDTGAQRERAHDLLTRLSTENDRDPLAAGESGMLSLATGDRQRALELLRAAVKRFPGSPRVRYALARAEREEAMASRDAAAMISRQWQKLIRLDRHLLPLQWLGPLLLLARIPTSDGELRKSIDELASWLFPRFQARDTQDPSFYAWWGKAVYGFLFGTAAVNPSQLDMERVRNNIRTHYRNLVTKEEELVYRHARR